MDIPDRIERRVQIHAPIQRVWLALTDAEELGRWFPDGTAELDLRPGGAATFRWRDEDGAVPAEVTVVEPPQRFAFRWASHGAGTPWTLVTFTLRELGADLTEVRVEESGFAAYDPATAAQAQRDNTGGWRQELDELVAHLEQPTVTR